MVGKGLWPIAPVVVVALLLYAVHAYEEHQAYKTGIYIGKAAFTSEDFKNQRCLSLREALQPACTVNDLNQDSVMEDALASAHIIPALADSTSLHTGFRDGWREARTVAFANR
jgi:hypothetical protein